MKMNVADIRQTYRKIWDLFIYIKTTNIIEDVKKDRINVG